MTSDRWRLVERLYHASLERPATERAAFLADACSGDAALRYEVQSLLDQASLPGFLEDPALVVAAAAAGATDPSWVGRQIGVYRVQSPLGRGGMGEVYRAHDVRLGRDVAIKVLPPGFTTDPDRLARFTREARTLASLNHPHIGTIHGFEETDPAPGSGQAPVRALILELVEGETLADRVARGPLGISEALRIARQIADALEAAHDRGIVHRDLKPANIKLTPEGVVKVLDFGLAKSDPEKGELAHSPTITAGHTEAGIILGTAAYMSPEQARGQPVDRRTDVWAFGCVLYEMLTGRIAFPGATVSDTIVAILQGDPDWSALPPTLPPGIVTLLHRCLEKDPRRRKRDIGDARAEIDDAIAKPAIVSAPGATAPSWAGRALPWALAVAGAIGTAVGFWPGPSPPPTWRNPLADAKFSPLTNFPGTESDAVISPDGRFLAFLSDQAGQFDVYVTQIGTGRFNNLTPDSSDERQNSGGARDIGFTGDGSEIWLGSSPQKRQMHLLPIMGGTPRRFLQEDAMNVSWSPDGKRIAYFRNSTGDPVYVADATGANPTEIYNGGPGVHNHGPVWSPDGQWIYFVRGYPQGAEQDMWRIRPSGGPAEALTSHRVGMTSLVPVGDHSVLYVARDDEGAGPWLWSLDLETKISHRVSSGLEHYTSLSGSADGRRLVASVATPNASLWSVPIRTQPVGPAEVRPFQLPSMRALAPRVRGTATYYLSALGTGDGLWRFQDQQATEIWRGSQGALLEPAAISPDGLRLAVVLRKGSRRVVTTMASDGTDARTLGEPVDVRGTVDWSPDGAWIVTGGAGPSGGGLYKIPVDGGAVERITSGPAIDPVWSPDGRLILYNGANVGGLSTLLAVRPDGTPVELPKIQTTFGTGSLRFLPVGQAVVYLTGGARARDFWLLDLSTMKVRQLTNIASQTGLGEITSFDIAANGTEIVFDRLRENSDIRLIELP